MNDLDKYREYLRWLISPQNGFEQQLFKENNLVDTYIEIESRIDSMSEDELIEEINIQLLLYHLKSCNLMKSKEEIINQLLGKDGIMGLARLRVIQAMDEYAKETVINFTDWVKDSEYGINSIGEWFSYESDEKPTTKQIFEQYKYKNK